MAVRILFPALLNPSMGSNVRADVAGAAAAFLASVPQSMAYGAIAVSLCGPLWNSAGVLAGLYSSAIAGFLSVVLGSNPLVVAGPRASTALMFAGLVGALIRVPDIGVPGAIAFACAAVVIAGLLQMAFGLLRVGRLADFVPYPVVAGFFNGSALLIILGQFSRLAGLPGEGVWQLAGDLGAIQPGTMIVGLITLAAILWCPPRLMAVPPAIFGLLVGTGVYYVAVWAGFADQAGGTLPPLPPADVFGISDGTALLGAFGGLKGDRLWIVAPTALSMAVLLSLDTVLTSVALDQVALRRSDTNRELVGQGLANVVCGLSGLLPCSGGVGRSLPLYRAGGRTALASLLAALAVFGLTAGFGRLVQFVPQAVMAGFLTAIGVQLFDRWTLRLFKRLFRRHPTLQSLGDFLVVAAVMGSTVVFDLVVGVCIGLIVTLVFFVVRVARSPVRRSYRATVLAVRFLGDLAMQAFLERYGDAIAVIELEGDLFFGSAAALQKRVDALMSDGVYYIVLDMKRVANLDVTAARTIERMHERLDRCGGLLVIAHVEPERRRRASGAMPPAAGERRQRFLLRRLWSSLDEAGSLSLLGKRTIVGDLNRAIGLCREHIAEGLAEPTHGGLGAPPSPAILRGLDRSALRQLRRYLTRDRFALNAVIVRQGDPPGAVFFVAGGRVEVSIDLPHSDRKMHIQSLSKGAIFGEMALLDPKPRSANIIALEECVCYRLSTGDFERLKERQPALAFRLLENLALVFAERLRASNVLIAELEG